MHVDVYGSHCSKGNSIDNASLLGGKQPGPFTWLSFRLWCQNASFCLQLGIYKHSSTLFPGVSAPGSLLKGFCCWSCSLLIMHTTPLPWLLPSGHCRSYKPSGESKKRLKDASPKLWDSGAYGSQTWFTLELRWNHFPLTDSGCCQRLLSPFSFAM